MNKVYRYQELAQLLPTRRPMLMLDRAVVDADSGRAEGMKAVSMNEAHFQGHFPGNPIMPGVLQVTAIAQLGGAIAKTLDPQAAEHYSTVTGLDRIKFRKPVFPGDLLTVEASIVEEGDDSIVVDGRTLVNGEVTCQGKIRLEMRSLDDLAPTDDVCSHELPKIDGVDLTAQAPIEVSEIEKIIPHRYPFLLVDRVLHMDTEAMRIVTLKNVTGNETFFAGLQVPAVPLPILGEIAAQAGCCLALSCPQHKGKLGVFMSIDKASLQTPPVPGDQLVIDATVSGKGRFGRIESRLYVGKCTVAEMALKFAVVEKEG